MGFPNGFKLVNPVTADLSGQTSALQAGLRALELLTDILQSPLGAAAVTVMTFAFQRPWVSRLIMYPVLVCGAMYAFEWSQYDRKAQKHALHKQFVAHAITEVRILSKHSSFNCAQNFSNHLQTRTANLFKEVKRIEESLAQAIE